MNQNYFVMTEVLPRDSHLPNSTRLTLKQWIKVAKIMIRNKKYSTIKHEYLERIIEDNHYNITFRKAAQVGISTLVLIRSLWVAEHLGGKVVYYFQDDKAVQDFSADRATPIIEASHYLLSRLRTTDRVSLKQIGPGSIYFRGLQSKGKAKSIDCDLVVLDELDEAREDIAEFAIDRLRHSELGWVIALSQPSLPGFGIDKKFSITDQHHWFIICEFCGHRNCLELDFPANFIPLSQKEKKSFPDGATHYRGCSKCKRRLNMAKGEWIPLYPGRSLRGYHLSQLYSQILPPGYPNVATKIMGEWEQKRASQVGAENFQISVLGFPYAGADIRVTEELLNGIEGDYGMAIRGSACFMGVDQGDILSIVITVKSGKILKVVYCEQTEKWGRLDVLMSIFGVHRCIIDAMPNKHSAKSFATKYSGRVYIQYFNAKTFQVGAELFEGKIEVPTVNLDRTESLDNLIDAMEQGFIQLPSRALSDERFVPEIEKLRRHLKQLMTKTEINMRGIPVRSYISGRGVENHLAMALNSAFIASKDLGEFTQAMVAPIFLSLKYGSNA